MKIKITLFDKIICSVVTIFSLFCFGYFFIHIYLLIADKPIADGFVNMHTNNKYDLCKHDFFKSNCKSQIFGNSLRVIFNIVLLSIFWVQHIMMAKIGFKKLLVSIIPRYMLVERPFYNILAALSFIYATRFWNTI